MSKATNDDLSWFNIDNYNFISNLTVKDFIRELDWRYTLFKCHDRETPLDEMYFEDKIKYVRIFRGDPNLEVLSKEEAEFNKEHEAYVKKEREIYADTYGVDRSINLPMLSKHVGISPLSFIEILMYAKAAEKEGYFSLERDEEYLHILPEAVLGSFSLNMPEHFHHKVLADIWLSEGTDEEILESMRKLLPKWRSQLNQPEPETTSNRRMGIKTFQKLIINRVLPILDLLFWSTVFDKEITNAQISHLVFPDDPKDSQSIKETIKPLALESMTEPYTRSLRLFINKDGEIGNSKISDILGRNL